MSVPRGLERFARPLRVPAPVDGVVLHSSLVAVFAGIAAVVALVMSARPAVVDVPVQATVVGAAGLVVAVGAARWRRPSPDAVVHLLLVGATTLAAASTAGGGAWAPALAIGLLGPTVCAAVFLTTPAWAAHLALAGVGYAAGAALGGHAATMLAFAPAVLAPAVVVGGVAHLVASRQRETAAGLMQCARLARTIVDGSPADVPGPLSEACERLRRSVRAAAVELVVEQDGERRVVTSAGAPLGADAPGAAGHELDAPAFEAVSLDGAAATRWVLPVDDPAGRAGLTITWPHRLARLSETTRHLGEAYAELTGSALRHRAQHRRLTELADTDPLTGLPNRRALRRFLATLERPPRRINDLPVAVAMLDLNGFKEVNDRHGHAAGDALLVSLAASWRRRLRGDDLLARFGGDEFVAVLPATDDEPARRALADLTAELDEEEVSCSFGVAVWDGEGSLDDALEAADRELYEAKRRLRQADRGT